MLKKKIIFYSFYFVFIALLFEFSFRAFYAISFQKYNILWRPFALMEHYYPGFLEIYDEKIPVDNGSFDVLLLGGSVLTPMWGDVPDSLHSALEELASQPVKIYNAAYAAHTSRDSWLKYQLLDKQNFDAIVFYHGINEVRFNHCPREMFKVDYNHVDFYAKVNQIIGRPWSRFTVLPLVFIQLKTNILKRYAEDNYMPLHAPVKSTHEDWLAFGLDVKTSASFRENLTSIIECANKKGVKIIIPEFGYYIPENYTLQDFNSESLDYARHRNPVELWGTVETVSLGINAHNQVVRELYRTTNFQSFDANMIMDKNKKMFDDLCHYTSKGSAIFAREVAIEIMKPNRD